VIETIPVWGDTETGSECNLKVCGAYRYAEDPSTFIQLFSYAIEDQPVKLWSPYDDDPMPDDLLEYLVNPKYIWTFHNAQFDRLIIRHCLKLEVPIRRFRCSMAQSLSHALPGSLEKCGEVLGLTDDQAKVKDGKKLVHLFCKPKVQKDGSLKWATPQTHPAEWARYKEYCVRDTESMRTITKKLPKWNYPKGTELELWFLDQEINDRGMYVDLEMVNAAVREIEIEKKHLAKRTQELTEDQVKAASQRDSMIRYVFSAFGIELPNMQKATLEKMIVDENLPDNLRELLEIRLSTCTSSTAKYKRFQKATCADSRVKGTVQYAGASRTARDSGKIVQPQNFPRPILEEDEILPGIDAIKNGTQDLLNYDTMELCSSALRYAICAPEGKKLVVADLANIEGRFLAWLAGEEWKLEAFRKYDTFVVDESGNVVLDKKGKPLREGPDMYVAAFAKAFRVREDKVGDKERAVGKVMELAFGFQGGCGAFLAFAGKVDLNALPDTVLPYTTSDVRKEAEDFYDWLDGKDIKEAKEKAEKSDDPFCTWEDFYEPKKTFGMERNVFVAIDCLKRQWRREHPAITRFWKDSEQALKNAVEVANVAFPFGKCKAIRKGKWVLVVLPSGRVIPYPGMRIGKSKKKGEVDENGDIVEEDDSSQSGKLVFRGVNQFNKQWSDIMTGAGKITENCTQAGARDVFKHGELLAAKAGYDIVLKVHDELVTEVPDIPEYSVEELQNIMSVVPNWAEGLPLAAAGKESYRYHK